MLISRLFLPLGFCLLLSGGAYAQRVPDVATAEAKAAASLQKATELKAAADAVSTALDATKLQVKEQEKTLKSLKKTESKQEGELRVFTTKQRAAELKAKLDQSSVKEAQKREKAAAKLAEKKK